MRWRISQIEKKDILLKTYDLNKNGSITSDEIDIVLERQDRKSEKISVKNGKKEFKKLDKDGNGYVSVDEYLEYQSRGLNALLGNSPLGEFLMRDVNGDSIVYRDEHREFVENLFLRLDKNKDEELIA